MTLIQLRPHMPEPARAWPVIAHNAVLAALLCIEQGRMLVICVQTFIFDKEGKVAMVFRSQLKAEQHIAEAQQVIKTLK